MSNPIRCLSFSSSFLFPWPLLLDWALIVAGMVTFTFTRPTMWVIHAAILTAMLYHTLRGPRRMVHATVGLLSIATLLAFFVLDPRHEQPLIPPPAAATISVPAAHTAQDRPGQEKTRAGESAGISRAAPGIAYESRLGRRLDDGPVNLLRGSISSHLPDLTVGGLAAEAMLQIELGLESLNAAFALWLFAAGLALTRWRLLWGLLVLATLAQLLLFDPIPRYFVPILPLLWLGLWASLAWAASRLWRRRWWPVWAALLLLLILPNLVLTARFLRDQNTRPLWAHDQGEYVAVVAMADQLDQLTPPDARILAEDGRALTWLSQRIALGSAAVARYPAEHVQQWLANQPAVYAVLIHRGGEVHGATSHLLDQMHATIGPALTVCTGPGQTLTLHRIRPASDADPP